MIHYVATDETGRINVTVQDKEYADETYFEFDFPDDFDFNKQNEYRIVGGKLVHEIAPPTKEEIEANKQYTMRNQINAATLLFVRTTNLSDEQALSVSMLHEDWEIGVPYVKDDRRLYKDELYRCIQDHVSQETWNPMAAPSLWAKILPGQSGDIGIWQQPGATNPYQQGDRVTHNGKTWISNVDGNIWEPGVYGWSELDGVDPSPSEEYPEYVVGKSYYKGDKITYSGEKYVCIYNDGLPCVWSPADYPAGWEKVQ